MLELEGFAAATASDGVDALGKLRKERPCAVVLDLLMPHMDGNQLYQRMRQDPELRTVPVIISTSDPARAPAGSVVVPKPVDVDRLLAVLRDACPPHLRDRAAASGG